MGPIDDAPAPGEPGEGTWARLQRLPEAGESPAATPGDSVPNDATSRRVAAARAFPEPRRQYRVAAPGSVQPVTRKPDRVAEAEPKPVSGNPRDAQSPRAAQPQRRARPPAAAAAATGGGAPANPGSAGDAEPSGRQRRSRRGKPWYRPKLRWFLLYLPIFITVSVLALGLWGWNQLQGLGRVDLEDSLAQPVGDARNYLIVGSDSREGLAADVENAGAIGLEVTGRRADTLIVLRLVGDQATMMSIPRDLWVTNPATGSSGRINATYAKGPPNLVRAIKATLGLEIHRYVEVDFRSFGAMVDALGGITIDFPNPVKDYNSGLNILRSGPARLDGSQSLAYVRSRHYTEIINGQEVKDPTADLGRQQRQQAFVRSLLTEVSDVRNPITLLHLGGAAASGMKVDQAFGASDAVDLAQRLAGATPESVVLPTTPANRGGASVLLVDEGPAAPVLAGFGTG